MRFKHTMQGLWKVWSPAIWSKTTGRIRSPTTVAMPRNIAWSWSSSYKTILTTWTKKVKFRFRTWISNQSTQFCYHTSWRETVYQLLLVPRWTRSSTSGWSWRWLPWTKKCPTTSQCFGVRTLFNFNIRWYWRYICGREANRFSDQLSKTIYRFGSDAGQAIQFEENARSGKMFGTGERYVV